MSMNELAPEHDVNANGTEPATASVASRVVQAAPGLARLAAVSGWHLLEWSVRTSIRTNREVMQSLASGKLPIQLVQQTVTDLRAIGRQALGLAPEEDLAAPTTNGAMNGKSTEQLHERGAELLYQSADVWFTEDVHPAYERILDEMAPDEARILRLLATEGPQPAVDVRTGRPFGIGSELIAGGLSMIGLRAGVRDMARSSAYQNNLFRLGLIWFSREEVEPVRYQVVEVQPDVADAIKAAGRMPKIVRRSIHLTPFGIDFCRTCLPIEAGDFWDGTPRAY
jgi:abortive infection alpha-like protein